MKYKHDCPEYDYLTIDESCMEFGCCGCYKDDDAKLFHDLHNRYIAQLSEAYSLIKGLKRTQSS